MTEYIYNVTELMQYCSRVTFRQRWDGLHDRVDSETTYIASMTALKILLWQSYHRNREILHSDSVVMLATTALTVWQRRLHCDSVDCTVTALWGKKVHCDSVDWKNCDRVKNLRDRVEKTVTEWNTALQQSWRCDRVTTLSQRFTTLSRRSPGVMR